jgi:hypothetical protein
MNNSAYSYVYRNIKGTLKDILKRLEGFGATYKFIIPPNRLYFADEK